MVLFEYCFVVSCDKGSHVFVTTAAHSYSVSVEEFVQFVVFREVFVDPLQKVVSDVGFHVFVVRRVVLVRSDMFVSDDSVEIRLLMNTGTCLKMLGG